MLAHMWNRLSSTVQVWSTKGKICGLQMTQGCNHPHNSPYFWRYVFLNLQDSTAPCWTHSIITPCISLGHIHYRYTGTRWYHIDGCQNASTIFDGYKDWKLLQEYDHLSVHTCLTWNPPTRWNNDSSMFDIVHEEWWFDWAMWEVGIFASKYTDIWWLPLIHDQTDHQNQ